MAGSVVQAQEGRVFSAVIIDSLEKTPIEKCTISVLVKGGNRQSTTSNEKGRFSLSLKQDTSVLLFQHVGYVEIRVPIVLSKISGHDTINLARVEKPMEEIVIKTAVPPIVVRDDTMEYNIDSSMFEPYDVAGDLVKRLPGLEIDANGKMSFYGKAITRILVDGEDLFGGDPAFSMKKLPAGMISKIQVMDTKTLEQIFNNIPPDGEDKTLNIKLKEGKKTFATADASAGTKNQLEGNAMLSQFEKYRKLSAMGAINSSNKAGLFPRQAGPTSSFANGGVNYGNKWNNLRVNGSYAFNENGNNNRIYSERTQLITADTSFFTKSGNQSRYDSRGHRLNVSANWLMDSTSVVDLSFSYSETRSGSRNSSSSVTLENGFLRNESSGASSSAGNYQSVAGTLLWTKRFNRKGRTLSINARTNLSNQATNLFSQTINTYFKTGAAVSGDTLDRQTKTKGNTNNYGINVNYMEPITKTLRLGLRGDFDFNGTTTDRKIFNLDSLTYTASFDSLYSARIFSSSHTQNLTASLVYVNQKWNVTSGISAFLQQAARTLQSSQVEQSQFRYSPSLNASFTLAKGKIIRSNFSATTLQPTIEQLQPVPDNSNPLYVRLGNPNLRTAFSQNYGINYNYFDTSGTLAFGINYSPTSKQIVNSIYYDEYRRQTSRFINVDGVYGLRGNFSLSRNRRNGRRTKSWGLSSTLNYGQQVFFQTNQQYYSRSYTATGNLSYANRELAARATAYTLGFTSSFSRNWTPLDQKILNTTRWNLAPKIEGSIAIAGSVYATASYQLWYNKFNYHSTLRNNDEYSIHHLGNTINFYIKKKFSVQSNLQYQYNTRVPEGTSKSILTCNLSSSIQVLEGRGQIVLGAFDLFSTNTNFRRVVGENYIEDVQMDNLRNYFTLRLQYNFNRLEKRRDFIKQ